MRLPRLFKVFFLLASFFLLFLFVKHPVHAQEFNKYIPYPNQYAAPETNPDVPANLHSYTQSVTIELMASAICQIAGIDPTRADKKCLGVDPKSGKIGFVENGGGAIGVTAKLIGYTFTPPTSSSEYVKYLAGNFGIAKKAYAAEDCSGQDPGLCGLTPLREIWVAMRNVVYIFFVAIFVAIGVAIMLRVHIDPRTVMTIENQIPRIIVGILLVTFSFAIAGLLIDLMYVAIYLVGGVLSPILAEHNPDLIFGQVATSSDPITASGSAFEWLDLLSAGREIVAHMAETILGVGGQPGILEFILDAFSFILATLVSLIAWLIIFLALLYTLLRLWIVLLIAYISILLDIVFAPFWFLIGLLPGSQLGVGAWFKDLIANLAVFPAAIAMFVLAAIFIKLPSSNDYIFTPPLVGGGLPEETFGQIIALGLVFMTPQVLTMIKQALKAPKVNFGPAFSPVTSGARTVIGTGRTAGASLVSSREGVINPDTGLWERRRLPRAVLGRFFK